MPRVSGEQRRRDLTAATVRVIVDEGPSAVTARRIADRAGTSLASVHYAFRDMDELTERANAEVLGIVLRALQSARTDRGVREFISDFLQSYVRYMNEDRNEPLAFFETFVSLIRPGRAKTAVTDGQGFLIQLMREAEKHDTAPPKTPIPELANLLLMAADGLSLIHLARGDQRQTAKDVKHLIAALQSLI